MSSALLAAKVVQILAGVGVPLALAVLAHRRWGARGRFFWLGLAAFLGAQLVRIPMIEGLSIVLRDWFAVQTAPTVSFVDAVCLGLAAGLCEETARYVVFRSSTGARSRANGLMVGIGHAGVESIILGVGTAIALVSLLNAERAGIDTLSGQEAIDAAAALTTSPWMPLLAVLERLVVIPVHLAASLLVLSGVVSRRRWVLPAAILWHAFFDAGGLWLARTHGGTASVSFMVGCSVVSLVLAWTCWRALPAAVPTVVRSDLLLAEPGGAPIELLEASKVYDGTVHALRAASLTLVPGVRTCLLGPNGAGKTSAIRLITGALAPTTGRVWLFGQESTSPAFRGAKRRTGIVPQLPGMYDDLTVREYLTMVRAIYGRGDVAAALTELDLDALAERAMSKISGGQQRRVVLAAAILPSPDLLILDEPSAGLDPVAAHAMIETLEKVTKGRTVLLCTHNLPEAERLCERVVILRSGRVLVHESLDVLRARTTGRIILAARQGAEALATALRAQDRLPTVDGERVELPGTRTDAPAILRALLGAGIDVEECRIDEPTLEDLFLSIVGDVERPSLPAAASAAPKEPS